MRYALICMAQLAHADNRGNEIDYIAAKTCPGGGCGAPNALTCSDQSCTQPGDVSKCGSSCASCSAPAGGYPTCGSSCGYACFDQQKAICGGCYPSNYSQKCGGCYADNDADHCGPNCLSCPLPTANATLTCSIPGKENCCCYTCGSTTCCKCGGISFSCENLSC
jgi:hypothetical protein